MLEHISQNWDVIQIAHITMGLVMGLLWFLIYFEFIKPEIDEARLRRRKELMKHTHTTK